MKRIAYCLATLALLISTGMMGSCGKSDNEKAKSAAQKKPTNARPDSLLPNYRYVDLDTILSRYNLAKDYNEEMLRMQNSAESQMQQHQTRIQNFAASVQKKMQNNGYLTKESYEADEKTMANMQNEAQKSMATLQNNLALSAEKAQKTINDSINAFIEEYNSTRGYDAIFFKGATLYISPDLDITNEIVEGLNARYNKVKK